MSTYNNCNSPIFNFIKILSLRTPANLTKGKVNQLVKTTLKTVITQSKLS